MQIVCAQLSLLSGDDQATSLSQLRCSFAEQIAVDVVVIVIVVAGAISSLPLHDRRRRVVVQRPQVPQQIGFDIESFVA